ncbi:MAG: PhoH family protein [Clostridia bacterium]|nr:PhoH family protein [Clostridia bacterium]
MEKILAIGNEDILHALFGTFDENVQNIEARCGVRVVSRNGNLIISGEESGVIKAAGVFEQMCKLLQKQAAVDVQSVRYLLSLTENESGDAVEALSDCLCITYKGKPIKPKSIGQKKYVESIQSNVVTFGAGPAGTGKTYLAVALAVNALKSKEVSRIILTRPAVEAGEKLGFLPGDLQDKVDPYLRPLYDALYDMMGGEMFQRYMEKGIIEIAPLAYMRGRTLEDSFIILDEAQNTSKEQMKMFLTRFGYHSKIVVTGDITQIDLPRGTQSGLVHALEVLKDVEGIGIHHFDKKDVVRHPLVQKIIGAYEKYEKL